MPCAWPPSNFAFTKPASRGFHRGLWARTLLLGQRRTCWNSCRWRCATPINLFNGQTTSPTHSLFRRFHTVQQVIAKTSEFSDEQNTSSTRSLNELTLENSEGKDVKQEPHTKQISSQNQRAWRIDSSPTWQRLQTEDGTILRLCKLSIVGMEFVQACQRKNFTLFGMFNFQRLFQNFFCPVVSKDEATLLSCKSHNKW